VWPNVNGAGLKNKAKKPLKARVFSGNTISAMVAFYHTTGFQGGMAIMYHRSEPASSMFRVPSGGLS